MRTQRSQRLQRPRYVRNRCAYLVQVIGYGWRWEICVPVGCFVTR